MPPLPSLMQRSLELPVPSHGSAVASPNRQRRVSGELRHVVPPSEITLYLEQKRSRPGVPPYLESVQVPLSSTVKDVRLKLQHLKGWHADTAHCSLVCSKPWCTCLNHWSRMLSHFTLLFRYWATEISWSMRWLGSWLRGTAQLETSCTFLSSCLMCHLSVWTLRVNGHFLSTCLRITPRCSHPGAPSHVLWSLPSLLLPCGPKAG